MMMLINLSGLLLIVLIIWWFWLYTPARETITDGVTTITVANGVYQPAHIKLPEGQLVTLRFLRQDASPCAATVLFSELDISEELPLNKTKDITLPALRAGHYTFSCQMQMYRGELIIEPEDRGE